MKKPLEMTKGEARHALETEDFAYAGGGVRKHWLEVRLGLKEHKTAPRGPDGPLAPRQVKKQVSVAKRYHDITGGRSIEMDMKSQQDMIALMFEEASQLEEPMERFKALQACQKAQADFAKTWLPYMEQKLGTMQSTTTVEEQADWDALLSAPVVKSE